jgi:ferredoxin-NADP reductase
MQILSLTINENSVKMEKYTVKILESSFISHDVKRIRVEKPDGYSFSPGQATEVAINRPEWNDKNRPFTFISLPEEDYLEFMIKTYPSRKGVTNELLMVSEQDELILHEVFGTITYRGTGTFIADGASVTPFAAILRQLQKDDKIKGHRLIFGNKTGADIFLEQEFKTMLDPVINISMSAAHHQ